MFIVQRPESVPCRDAKAVAPSDVPPMKPQYLPRPYGWEIFHRKNDPNNPYNLIQAAPPAPIRGDSSAGTPEPLARDSQSAGEARVPGRSGIQSLGAPLGETARPSSGSTLALVDREVEDLVMIVDLSQRRAPASFTSDGSQAQLRLARSLAFEARVRSHLNERGRLGGGPVVLFVADSNAGGVFYGNLTFVQDGIAFHPSSEDPDQLGLIQGQLGRLENGSRILGYVVLPERLDPTRPIDVYWNDRQLTATFQP